MKRHLPLLLAGVTCLIGLSWILTLSLPPASAQDDRGQNTRTNDLPLAEILERISQSGEVVALGDSSVQKYRAPMPHRATTPGNVEQQIKTLVKALPAGTIWVKLYLPAPADRRWNGDTVAQYVMAQAQVTGKRIGGETPPGTLEILGQQVPEEQGKAYVTGLKLKLVYLITNPTSRQANANNVPLVQVQQFQTLDANGRFQALMQVARAQMQTQDMMNMLWKQLTPEEAVQFKQMMAEQMDKEKRERLP